MENVSNWSTKELGLNNIFEQVDKFAVQEQEHIGNFLITLVNLVLIMVHLQFTKKDVDFCIDQKCANLKVASCDVTNLDLIEYVISKDYPTQIALGMASLCRDLKLFVKLYTREIQA